MWQLLAGQRVAVMGTLQTLQSARTLVPAFGVPGRERRLYRNQMAAL
jgi:hypothetical protein